MVEFDWKWSKTTIFRHFGHHFWYKLTFNQLLQSFNRLFRFFNWTFWSLNWSFNQNRSNLYRKRLILYRNCDRRFGFVIRFRIGPKSMIEIGHLGIWIVDNSIPIPESHLLTMQRPIDIFFNFFVWLVKKRVSCSTSLAIVFAPLEVACKAQLVV